MLSQMTKGHDDIQITVAELTARTAEILVEVPRGRTYVVVDGGTPVAVVGPPTRDFVACEATATYGSPQVPLAESAVARIIGTRATRAVLAVFVRDPLAALHQREVTRRAGIGLRSAQLALERLVGDGFLVAERDGNRLYYRASRNQRFEQLRELLARETGGAAVIFRHLANLAQPVERAFIFGSAAQGTDTLSSDIDLLVVTDASADDLVEPIAMAQRELDREIDLVHYRVADYRERLNAGNHFLLSILSQPRIDLIGEADER